MLRLRASGAVFTTRASTAITLAMHNAPKTGTRVGVEKRVVIIENVFPDPFSVPHSNFLRFSILAVSGKMLHDAALPSFPAGQ